VTELPRPRIERETLASARLAPAPPALLPDPSPGMGTLSLILTGTGALILGLAGLETANFVFDQFARSLVLGWITLGVAATGFGLIGAGIWRELRGLISLHNVEALRTDFVSADPDRIRHAARRWLARLPDGAALRPAVDAANDPDAIVALLRAGPVATLRAQADALGRTAALQTFAATAAIPSASLDGMLVAWRGTRLIRQIAEANGLHPGLLGTLKLLRRTLTAATTVAAADLAADTASRALLSNPLLAHIAGDVAGASLAARRMLVLARASAAACSPVPPG
jgi:putative membrane protein